MWGDSYPELFNSDGYHIWRMVRGRRKSKRICERRTNACLFSVTVSKSNPPKPGFLFQILWCSQTDYHSQEDLAIFGHRPDVKVKNIKNWLVFWLPAVEIWWFLFLFGNLAKSGSFFQKKSCDVSKSYFWGWKNVKICRKKRQPRTGEYHEITYLPELLLHHVLCCDFEVVLKPNSSKSNFWLLRRDNTTLLRLK